MIGEVFGSHKTEIENYAISAARGIKKLCVPLARLAAMPICPGDSYATGRGERASLQVCTLAAYAMLRAVVQKRRFPPDLEERCLDRVDFLLVEHPDYAGLNVDDLMLQEYWQRVEALRKQKQGVSVWICIAETFLQDLNAGGLRGPDALMAPMLTHALAGTARIYEDDLKRMEKRFRLV